MAVELLKVCITRFNVNDILLITTTVDIGSPDPEIMSPENIVKFIKEQFKDSSSISIKVIDDVDTIKKEYPLAHAVTRASLAGNIIFQCIIYYSNIEYIC